jgi:hypothetical protein
MTSETTTEETPQTEEHHDARPAEPKGDPNGRRMSSYEPAPERDRTVVPVERKRSTLLTRRMLRAKPSNFKTGWNVVIYKGGNELKTVILPGKWHNVLKEFTDGTGDGDGKSTYVFDRITEKGEVWARCDHPGHLVFFMHHQNDGGNMYRVLWTTAKSEEVAQFRRQYAVSPETGEMILRAEHQRMSGDLEVMMNDSR